MGTKDFTEEYIRYLERNNENLQNQSIRFKEFQSRLLNKELRNKHYELAVEDITNICRSTCEAIDKYFNHFNATMESLKNVLMWKSQVLKIPERLTMALHPELNEYNQTNELSNNDSGLINVNDNNQGKKGGTAKVCPMIRGHVISAPRIHLNRLNEDVGPQSRRPLSTPLSPIIEQSPGRPSDERSSPGFENIQLPLHRLRLQSFGKKTVTEDCCKGNASPKINFTKGKCAGFVLRKRYSSMGISERFRMMRERRVENINGSNHDEEVSEDDDAVNEETPNYATEVSENADTDGQNIPQDTDPLEGPSWLLDKQPRSEGSDSGLSSIQCRFVNFRRHNQRSNRSLNGEDSQQKRDVLNINDDAQMGNFEVDHTENLGNNSFLVEEGTNGKNFTSENEELSSSDDSDSSSRTDMKFGDSYDSEMRRTNVNCLPFIYPMARCSVNLERKSIHHTEDTSILNEENPDKPILRSSGRISNQSSNDRDYSNSEKKSLERDLFNCTVNLEKLPRKVITSRVSETPKRSRISERESVVERERKILKRGSSNKMETPRTPRTPVRTKRRVAAQCIANKVWVDKTPRWEAKIKQQAEERGRGKSKNVKNKKKKPKKCDKINK